MTIYSQESEQTKLTSYEEQSHPKGGKLDKDYRKYKKKRKK